MIQQLLDRIVNAPPATVYLTVGLLVFAEDALFVGFVLPGETAAILGGVAASQGHVDLAVMILVVVTAAIVGDSVGYEVGRHVGTRLLHIRPLRRHEKRLAQAEAYLARRGGSAVFLGRFVAFLRAVMPALAGISRMPYLRFLAFNAAGGVVWGVSSVLLGYLAGNSYARIEQEAGRAAAVVVAAVVIVIVIIWRIRKSRAERALEGSTD